MSDSDEMLLKNQCEQMVWQIFENSKYGLTDFDMENISDLLEHSEWGVALELICTQLDEHDVKPGAALLQQIIHATRKLELDESTWKFLETE